MPDGEAVTAADGRVTLTHGAQLTLRVNEGGPSLTANRRRVEVVCAVEVSAPGTGGRLTVTTRPRRNRRLTVFVEVRGRYQVVPETAGDDQRPTYVVTVRRGQTRRLVVVEHSASVTPDDFVDLLPGPDEFWVRELDRSVLESRAMPRMAPPPEAAVEIGRAFEEPQLEAMVAAERPPPLEELPAEEPAAEEQAVAAEPVLAEVGANMPSTVHLDDAVPVEVRLSRGEVHVVAGQAHDEQVIVVDPTASLDVTLLRRGFDLEQREAPPETGRRSLMLPAPDEPDVRVVFWLRAAQEGEGEVQVVVRQREPQPLATLRLISTVLPRSAAPADRATAAAAAGEDGAPEVAVLARGVTPFLTTRTLTVDENLVGSTSELSFELILPGVRRGFAHVVADKTAVLTELFRRLDEAWRDIGMLPDSRTRSRSFHERLRSLGASLARAVLPPGLLELLRDNLEDIDELTVITSGETDIPWELVHVWDPDVGEDAEGRGFLGRVGLVRWVYNTAHPTELSVRNGRAHYLIPEYADPGLVLSDTALESSYLQVFGATPVSPPDSAGIAELLGSGEVDLLHFAGHGLSNDSAEPPVRQMLLADYRLDAADVADRSRAAYSLDDLRGSLPFRPPLALSPPGPIVFLNACRIGQAPSTRSEVGGFAETFLRGGAGAFIGCLWSVGDEPARAFVEAFYGALDAGRTIGQATLAGRQASREAGDLSWLAYTVYAHPDARLADRPVPPPEPDRHPSPKGTAMTITSSTAARKAPPLTTAQLVEIHPYVVCMEDGRLAEGASTLPTSVDDFATVKADVDAIFETHLPAFIAQRGQPVPMMVWAHGGLVDKGAGLRVAHLQVRWWQANGVFPVHFVWRTGLAESLWDAVKDSLPGRARGLDDFFDGMIEAAVRGANGKATWGAMKTTAKLASDSQTGGAWYFAQKLGEFLAANPGSVTVHAAGHSAGSIFHSYLVPEMLSAGVPSLASLSLLAPAIRVDEFKQRVMKKSVFDKIDKLALFTMKESFEKDDTCIGIYRKSLLYLIRGALENEQGAEILGLQECLRRDPALGVLIGQAGSGDKGEVMWSQTVGGGPRTSSRSTTHGGFDNDEATMNSLARRVLDNDHLAAGWGGARGLGDGDAIWRSEEEVLAYIAVREAATPAATNKRALCIGIDEYPSLADQLGGCVADARAWKLELEHAGFAVEIIENGDATRQHIVERIQDLIVKSTPGDVLVVQYSGHGTTIEDLDGDDREEAERTGESADEALCPVDFRDGELLIDDDLGELWDLLPDGVNLTVFFDSCHSGGNQRAVLMPTPDMATRKARLVRMTTANVEAYKAKRGTQPPATASRDRERSVYFGACQAREVAFESNGQGDFTRRALPRIREFLTSSNQAFYDAVLADFGDDRQQTPVLLPSTLASRTFLGSLSEAPPRAGDVAPTDAPPIPDPSPFPTTPLPGAVTPRERAVARILRGVADLIES